jgi:hypothetical protein
VRVAAWAVTLLLGCGSALAPAPRPAPAPSPEPRIVRRNPPRPNPFLPPVKPSPETADTESEKGMDIHSVCARDADAGVQLCQQLVPGDPSECAGICLEDYRRRHAPPAASPSASSASGTVPVARAAAPRIQPADPFALALGDCIRRVREAGDAEVPACHFFRPLDQMDFGQRHCDAKCAELTEGYRTAHAMPTR